MIIMNNLKLFKVKKFKVKSIQIWVKIILFYQKLNEIYIILAFNIKLIL